MKQPAEALFAANVPFSFTDDQLAELFEPFGLVITCRIARDREGNSKGFGFVELAPDKARAKAIAALNGTMVDGRKIEVRLTDPPKQAPRRPRPPRAQAPAPPPAEKRSVLVEYRKLSAQRPRSF